MRLRAEVPRHALAGQLVLSKPGLLCQLVPSLEMSYVLRELFRVPGGEGRILNIDDRESMTYRYDQNEKSWTYQRQFTLLLFQET